MKKLFIIYLNLIFLSFFSLNSFGQVIGVNTINSTGTNFSGNPTGVSGKNWTSVVNAVTALTTYGVSGPVTFNIASGSYPGRITIAPITGASATNTISFIGTSRDSVTITFAGTTAANRATVVLNGADYITFKNIRIQNTGATYATSVLFTAQADYNTIDNCDLRIDSTSTSVTASTLCNVLAASAENSDVGYSNCANYNLIQNCRIIGGNFGIKFNGTSASVTCVNNYFLKNIFRNQYTNCIYNYYQSGGRIENNYLYNVRNTASYGISSYYSNNTKIIGNNVQATQYGIYLSAEINATGASSIVNNMVSNLTNTTAQYGIYLTTICTFIDILHNSVIVSGTAASTTSGAICIVNGSTIRILNNNLKSFGFYPCITFATAAVFNPGDIDYNVMYNSAGNSISYWKTAQYTSIVDLKNIDINANQNSLQTNSDFVSNTDLHLISTTTGRFAKPITTVTTDIDGDARCNLIATIGCDEFKNHPSTLPSVAFTSKDTVNTNTAVTFTNIASAIDPIKHSWYVNGVLETNDLNMIKFFTTPGTYNIKLVSQNCYGLDSFKKNIVVNGAAVTPTTYIIDASGGGNFLTFTAAFASLSTGITTPIVFIVKPGIYTERLVLTPVTGASSTNTISFIGVSKYNCILNFAGTAAANRATVVLNGADYFRFSNLKITNTGASFGMTLFFTGQADYNIIDNCILWVTSNTTDNIINVFGSGVEATLTSATNSANYNTIQNCRIVNGNYGIRFNGTSNTVACANNNFLYNDLDNQYTYGIYAYYLTGTRFENNYIHNVRNLTSYGIYSYNSSTSRVIANDIHSHNYGVYFSSENMYITGTSLIANNMISDLTYTSSQYGIYLTSTCTAVDILHNSVIVSGSSASTVSGAICIVSGSAIRILNNSLMSFGFYPCLNILPAASFAPGAIDYNVMFNSTGGSIVYWLTADFSQLVYLKRVNANFNQNSLQVNPDFVSNTNLHLNPTAKGRFGKAITGINTDFDGDVRCSQFATIGADEFSQPCNSIGIDVAAGGIVSPLIKGNNSFTFSYISNKIDSISTLSFGYQVNTNTPVTESNITLPKKLGMFDKGNYTFTTPLNFPAKGNYTLKYWVTKPNGSADNDISNDTVIITVYVADTFIINQAGGGDFLTFNSAITSVLKTTTGIYGPVVFLVKTGTYTERIVLNEVIGASSTCPITFIGVSADSVTLSFSGTSTSNRATVVLSGGDYYRFKNLKVQGLGTFGTTFLFTAQADNNIIENCNLWVSTSVITADVINVLFSSSESSDVGYANNANNNLIQNCNIKGGFYGIRFNGTSNTVNCTNNYMINNEIYYVYTYGIYYYYQNGANIESNNIHDVQNSSSYGISAWNSNNSRIYANNVQAHRNGIDINAENRYITGKSLIANNMIRDLTNMFQYGINLTAVSSNVDILHNSIVVAGGPTPTGSTSISMGSGGTVITAIMSTGASVWINDGSYNRVLNNSFLQLGAYPCLDIETAAVLNPGDIDNNVMFNTSGGPIAYWVSSLFTDLAQLKHLYPKFNQNSFQANPDFVSNTNLHINSISAGKFAKPIDGITTDADGDPRCPIIATIGADEFNHLHISPVAGFVAQDTIFLSSPFTFTNIAKAGEPKKHSWYVNGVFQTNDLNFTKIFTTPSSPIVMLVTENCFSSDSFTKTFVIDTPAVTPVSEFITPKYFINEYDSIAFVDMSLNYPSSWQWQISPDSIMDTILGYKVPTFEVRNGDLTVQNPLVRFLYPGVYSVGLISSNFRGSSPLEFKKDYINVLVPVTLCTWPFSSNESYGTLCDAGGPNGNFTKNTNCNFLIAPSCASIVTLKFTDVDIKSVDYLRIYDGKDATGIPLWDLTTFGPFGIKNVTWGDPKFQTTYTALSGSMYIEFTTDIRIMFVPLGRGFSAEWTSIPGTFSGINASFLTEDSVCLGKALVFQNTTTGNNLSFNWDFDHDGFIDDAEADPSFTYFFDGVYNAILYASSCGIVDTFSKQVKVYIPTTAPVLDFIADNTSPARDLDIVTLSDMSTGCTDKWTWQISPNTYNVVTNNLTSSEVGVIFHDTGCYNITLISGYSSGSDTISKICYIKPIVYCIPSVANLNPDIAINRVVFGKINNPSDLSSAGYIDYSNKFSTKVEKGETDTITLYRATARNVMNRKVWIDWNIDGDFTDAGELVAAEPTATTTIWSASFLIPTNAKLGITRMRVGVSFDGQSNTPCGINSIGEFEDYRIIVDSDFTKPVITLNGSSVINIGQCKSFTDPGATASDNIDGNITSNIIINGTVDTCILGKYIITYNVSDNAGNKANEVIRTINVVQDTTKPVITLIGKRTIDIEQCMTYTDPGVIVTDDVDTTITTKIVVSSNVNTSIVGSYQITYNVTDSSGNKANEVTRTVNVTPDAIAPVLALNGKVIDTIHVFSAWSEPGYVASDTCSGLDTVLVQTNLDTANVGVYSIGYTAIDKAGNPRVLLRTIYVIDTISPIVTSLSPDTILLDIFNVLIQPALIITDNYYKTFNTVISGTFYTNFPNGEAKVLGYYTLDYIVKDGSGNSNNISFVVKVVDRVLPEIELMGSSLVQLCRYQTLTSSDDSVLVTDNYDISPVLSRTGTYITDYSVNRGLGLFELVYVAKDQSGNIRKAYRYINVVDCQLGLADAKTDQQISIYPNPNNGRFTIEFNQNFSELTKIYVVNSLGELIREIKVNKKGQKIFEVDMIDVSPGIYFLHIQQGAQHTMQRINILK